MNVASQKRLLLDSGIAEQADCHELVNSYGFETDDIDVEAMATDSP